MVSGQLPVMARNLVGLLVALLLCCGGVQGHNAERPRVGVSSRRPDSIDTSTAATHTSIVYNSTKPAGGVTENRLDERSTPTGEGAVRTESLKRSLGAFRSREASVISENVTSNISEKESVTNVSLGLKKGEVITSAGEDLKQFREIVPKNKDQRIDKHESSKDIASYNSVKVINNHLSSLMSLRDRKIADSSEVDRVDGRRETLNTNGLTEDRTISSLESTVVTSERGDFNYNLWDSSDKDSYQDDVDGEFVSVGILTSSEKSVTYVDARFKKGRRSPVTVAHEDKISTSEVTVASSELSTALAATGEALWDPRRRQRQATVLQEEATEMIPACRKFVEGNPEKREFYSPNFPGNYPNNTDCIKVLTAEPGHLLRLDFRDEFNVEPSEGCRFDYLEVRDGAHGYENLIGTFCGKDFPPMMTSSGRHLWLRFHSDENIEYSGFTAVYESMPKPTTEADVHDLPECLFEVGGSEGFLNTTADIDQERKQIVVKQMLKLECMWIIRVKPGWKIQLAFHKFDLAKPNDCVSNFVDIFADRTDLPSRLKSFCGSIADMVTSNNHILHVRFVAEHKAISSTFVALYTAFRDSKLTGSVCAKDEFDCQDERCISGDLRCNKRINCRFRWDEDECSAKISPMEKILRSDHIIIILVVFSLIMFGMCFAFVFNCVRKLMHDHKVIQENFRVSREGRLDEIGIKLPSPRQPSIESSASRRPSATAGVGVGPECYVPGSLLPILVGPTTETAPRPSNGDAVFARRDAELSETDEDDDDIGFPAPEMRDNECQTRESLFHCSERSVTPPPPPPPPVMARHHHHHHPPQPPVGQFSTFGYTRDNRREDRGVKETPRHPPPTATTPTTESARFRAEAVIEMEGRGFSVDSTKSAPDVIVTH